MTKLSEILPALGAMFLPSEHKERVLPGSGKWYYVPWTLYLQRLNQVCPDDWEMTFSEPRYLERNAGDKLCFVTCTLIICGVARQGIGSVPAEILSSSGKNAERGNAVERAVAEALKNAAEMFGMGAYLDQQTDQATKEEFIGKMTRSGIGNALAFHHQNEGHTAKRSPSTKSQAKPFGIDQKPNLTLAPKPQATAPTEPELATLDQRNQFWALAQKTGYTQGGAKCLVKAFGFASSTEITVNAFHGLCTKAADPDMAVIYNDRAEKESAPVL